MTPDPRPTAPATDAAPAADRPVGLRRDRERGPVLLALMVTTGLIAVEATILATAVPTIVADLGGFASFPWLFSAYLLTTAVTVPVYSKVADVVGRKPVILVGIALFLAGSLLAGLATSMAALIVARAVQGLGAGAVQPMAITIAGDIYSVAERSKVQGYIAAVWASASVIGPTLGGVFAQYLDWSWIFWVNLPIGAAAAWLLVTRFHERVERRTHRIDWLGGLLLTTGSTALLLALIEGGHAWAWDSSTSVAAFVAAALLLGAFVAVQTRAPEPVLPLWVLSRRLLGTTALIAVGVGVLLMGVTTYVPTFLEAELGVPPLVSGLALAALTLGWPISASQAGRVYLRIGFRRTTAIGAVVTVAGATTLAATSTTPSLALVAVSCFVMGLGLGFVAAPSLIAAQASVGWGDRGVVTGANMFARSMGSAVGVAALGALVNAIMRGADPFAEPARFNDAATAVFVAAAVVAVLTTVAALAMPRDHGMGGADRASGGADRASAGADRASGGADRASGGADRASGGAGAIPTAVGAAEARPA